MLDPTLEMQKDLEKLVKEPEKHGRRPLVAGAREHGVRAPWTPQAATTERALKAGDGEARRSGGAPRLHFELRKDGKPIDPIRNLVPL